MKDSLCSKELTIFLEEEGYLQEWIESDLKEDRDSDWRCVGYDEEGLRIRRTFSLANVMKRLREKKLITINIRGYGVFRNDLQERTSVFAYDVEVMYMRDMTLIAFYEGADSYDEAAEWGIMHALQNHSEYIYNQEPKT